MLERDRLYLSKYAINPDFEEQFEGIEWPDFESRVYIDSNLDDIDLDKMDEDLWDDY